MKATRRITASGSFVLLLSIAGCTPMEFDPATGHAMVSRFDDVVLDTEGVDSSRLHHDVDACRKIRDDSDRVDVLGAVVGGVIGAAVGNALDEENGAAVGGTLGALEGSSDEAPNKEVIFRNCLKGRGYRVLN